MRHLINRPCVLRRRLPGSTIDRDGNEVPQIVEVATVCEVQQRQRRENVEEIGDARWLAFFLATEEVGSGDELVVDGLTYQVEGDSWRARNPRTGEFTHVEATLRRVAGAEDL